MGQVYLAYDQRLDRRVAIKHIRPDKDIESIARQRLRREARAAAALAHPVIVQVFDILETDDGDWIVLEYVEGQTLAQRLKGGPLEIPVVLGVARDVAAGLAYAHAKGFIHRDLKTENVILSDLGLARILDFGLAKNLTQSEGSLTAEGNIVGTFRAMSPEQAMGGKLDGRSDLFSFGVLLYECLTARPLFEGKSAAETLTRICTHQPASVRQFRPEVPPLLARSIDALLAKLPEARLDLDELIQRLGSPEITDHIEPSMDSRASLDGETIDYPAAESSDGGASALTPLSRSWKWPSAVGGLLALLLLSGAVLWQGQSGSSREGVVGGPSMPLPERTQGDLHPTYVEGLKLLESLDKPGDLDRAVNLFTELVALEPASATAHAGLAKARWQKFRLTQEASWGEGALVAAQRAVELGEFVAMTHASLGSIQLEFGEFESARESFETALRLDPTSMDAHLGIARHHSQQGEVEAAEQAYRRALEVTPDNRLLLDEFGALLFEQARFDEAEEVFKRSIEVAPGGVFGYGNLAGVYFMRDEFDAAAATLQRGLEIHPHSYLYTNLGTLFFYQGLYEQAIVPLKKAVEIDTGPFDPITWGNLGDAYRWTPGYASEMREAYQQAIDLLRDQIEKKPEDPTLRGLLALYLARQGDRESALQEAAQLEQREALRASIRFQLAQTYEQCGERERALETLAKALELGYPRSAVENEQELDRLRADPRFSALARNYR